jgi:hypothetical protein
MLYIDKLTIGNPIKEAEEVVEEEEGQERDEELKTQTQNSNSNSNSNKNRKTYRSGS